MNLTKDKTYQFDIGLYTNLKKRLIGSSPNRVNFNDREDRRVNSTVIT